MGLLGQRAGQEEAQIAGRAVVQQLDPLHAGQRRSLHGAGIVQQQRHQRGGQRLLLRRLVQADQDAAGALLLIQPQPHPPAAQAGNQILQAAGVA
jgi:hypothetical protein